MGYLYRTMKTVITGGHGLDFNSNRYIMILGMPAIRDIITGKFKRTHQEWSIDNWNDGFFTNKGRFLVYYPTSSHVLYEGYALRYYVVWELMTKKAVPQGYVLHHKNGNKKDDIFTNLDMLTKKEHDILHGRLRIRETSMVCKQCSKAFMIKNYRLHSKDWKRGSFCSQLCYKKAGGRWHTL